MFNYAAATITTTNINCDRHRSTQNYFVLSSRDRRQLLIIDNNYKTTIIDCDKWKDNHTREQLNKWSTAIEDPKLINNSFVTSTIILSLLILLFGADDLCCLQTTYWSPPLPLAADETTWPNELLPLPLPRDISMTVY